MIVASPALPHPASSRRKHHEHVTSFVLILLPTFLARTKRYPLSFHADPNSLRKTTRVACPSALLPLLPLLPLPPNPFRIRTYKKIGRGRGPSSPLPPQPPLLPLPQLTPVLSSLSLQL